MYAARRRFRGRHDARRAAHGAWSAYLRSRSADEPEEAVVLVVRPGREEQAVGRACSVAVSKLERPQPVDHDRMARRRVERPVGNRTVAGGTEGVDQAVAEVADENVAGGCAEVVRRERDAP